MKKRKQLHLVFGTETNSSLKEFVQLFLHSEFDTNFAFSNAKENGAFRWVRIACNTYQRGCEKSGVPDHLLFFFLKAEVKNPIEFLILILDSYVILNGLLDNSEINRTSSAELHERSECNSSERVRFISNCHEGHSICI